MAHRLWIRLGIVISLLTYMGAVVCYPGGSYQEPAATKHDILHNYVCDLARERAHNGLLNPCPELSQVAMLSLSLAYAAFTWPWTGPRLRWLALLPVLGATLVVLPVDASGRGLHNSGILLAGLPALLLSTIALREQVRRGRRLETWLGVAAVSTTMLTASVFVWYLLWGVGEVALPGLQKTAAVLCMAWMFCSDPNESKSPSRFGHGSRCGTRGGCV